MAKEIWVDIKEYEGMYKISNLGNVMGLARINPRGWQMKPRMMSVFTASTGYPSVKLTKYSHTKSSRMHRLLADAFIPNPEKKPFVNHIDGVKSNNKLSNLEWCTRSENVRHAYATGLMVAPMGKRYAKQYKSVLCLDMKGVELAIFKGVQIAATVMKINRPTLSRVLKGELKSAYGYKFKYA